MPIQVIDDKSFHLFNDHISYALRWSEDGFLEHLYFGASLGPLDSAAAEALGPGRVFRAFQPAVAGDLLAAPGTIQQEMPTYGGGDYRPAALMAFGPSGHSHVALRFISARIESGKPKLGDLPSARGEEAQTLILTMVDDHLGLACELRYSIWADSAFIARSQRLHNNGSTPIAIDRAASLSLDFPAGTYDVLHFTGSWAREFAVQRHRVAEGTFSIQSSRGTSSAAHSPMAALLDSETAQEAGAVHGLALVYSGNFQIAVDRSELGTVRMMAGINPEGFSWQLAAGESFETPEALLSYTDGGLGAHSAIWHDFVRRRISPNRFAGQPRPTYLNTWEAAYFDIDAEKVVTLATKAKALGCEMLVLDDGWFRGRTADTKPLGDWSADPERFPDGITELAKRVRAGGLKFGLWLEPEMAGPDSSLYRDHPDWILQQAGRSPIKSRHQYTLDLSREDVVDHLTETLSAILSSGQIDYIKWDMNRPMTLVGSSARGAAHQGETAHRYMLGLYRLLRRVTEAFPDILFENCAAGGARLDLAMLSLMHQAWPSDGVDPISRLRLINGASHFLPLSVLASYIGPSPNHQNGRHTSMETRVNGSFFAGARGISLNMDDMEKHADALQAAVELYKASADLPITGSFHRLAHTADYTIWQMVSADRSRAYIGYFQTIADTEQPMRRIRLKGLDADALYQVSMGGHIFQQSGRVLMARGLDLALTITFSEGSTRPALPFGDFASCLYELVRIS